MSTGYIDVLNVTNGFYQKIFREAEDLDDPVKTIK